MCDRWPCGSRSMPSGLVLCWATAASRLSAVVVLPTPPFWLKTAMIAMARRIRPKGSRGSSNDVLAHLRDHDLRGDDDDHDGDQYQCDAIPLEEIERGIQRHADAARADQSEHGRLAHVDVPPEQR